MFHTPAHKNVAVPAGQLRQQDQAERHLVQPKQVQAGLRQWRADRSASSAADAVRAALRIS